MPRAIWSPQAESELEEIVFHIRVRDGRPETARRIAQELYDEANRRTASSYRGQTYSNAPEGWLYFRFRRWLIFNHPHPDGMEVMRVIDGSRDLPQQFQET